MGRIHKIGDGAGFIAIDLDDAEQGIGVVRCARKILQSGAKDLARAVTYQMASLERKISGVSGGFNADGDDRDATVANLVAELVPLVESGEFMLDPAKGLSADDFARLRAVDARGPARSAAAEGATLRDRAIASGVVAAVHRFDPASVAVEGTGGVPDAVRLLLSDAGATITEPDLTTEVTADVVVVGSKVGVVDHRLAERIQTRAVVPWDSLPVTARALAVLERSGAAVLPDFVTTAGDVATWRADGSDDDARLADAADTVSSVLDDVADHQEGPFMAACYRAEAFLSTWQESLPFGRPLAP